MKTYFSFIFCLALLSVFPHISQAQGEDLLAGECNAVLYESVGRTLKLTFSGGNVQVQESNNRFDPMPTTLTYDPAKAQSRTAIGLDAEKTSNYIIATMLDNGQLFLDIKNVGYRICEYSSPRALPESEQTARIEEMGKRLVGEWEGDRGAYKAIFSESGKLSFDGYGTHKGTFKVVTTGSNIAWMQLKSDDGQDWTGYAVFDADHIADMGVLKSVGQTGVQFKRIGGAAVAAVAAPVEAPPAEVVPVVAEVAPAPVEAAPQLAEKELDYVLLAGTIACYNMRLSDAKQAGTAVAGYLESEGLKAEEYIALEKEHGAKPSVRAAIKEEMELCPTRVLPGMEEAATAEPVVEEVDCTKTPEHEMCKVDCKKTPTDPKCEFNFGKRSYSASYSASGVTGGKIVFNFDKNGKSAGGFISGKVGATAFTISLRGTRDKNNLKLSGSGKNSGTANITLNKTEAKGSFSGTANGRALSFSFTSKTK